MCYHPLLPLITDRKKWGGNAPLSEKWKAFISPCSPFSDTTESSFSLLKSVRDIQCIASSLPQREGTKPYLRQGLVLLDQYLSLRYCMVQLYIWIWYGWYLSSPRLALDHVCSLLSCEAESSSFKLDYDYSVCNLVALTKLSVSLYTAGIKKNCNCTC